MTLTETAALTKKGMVAFAVFLFVSITGWLGYQYYYYNIYLPSLPKEEAVPDTKFGLLPKLNIATSSASPTNFSYSLDTTTGELPTDVPKLLKVFFIPQLGTTLLAPDRAKALATSFGFTNGPELLSTTEYKFTDNNDGQFIIDLDTSNFKYVHRLIATESASLQTLDQDEVIPDQARIIQDFKNYLASKNLLPEQLRDGRTKVTYEKPAQQDSSHALISLWQSDVEELPIVTSKFTNGLINGLVTKYKTENQRFLTMDYVFWPIDETTVSTYPIKDPQTAFDQLKKGQGIVLLDPQKPQASVTSVYLAYFLSDKYIPYLQPVYVFEGIQFAAIVPAVTDEFIEK